MSIKSLCKRLKAQIREAGNESLSVYLDKCKFTILDNTEITVEGYVTISTYTEDEILFDTKNLTVQLYGRGLTLSYLKPSVVRIRGFVTDMKFVGE